MILLTLFLFSLMVLAIRFGSEPLAKLLNIQEKAGLRVQADSESAVWVNKKEVGKTPYQSEELGVGDYLVEIRGKEASWSGYVKLNNGTLSVVNRDLSPKVATSSGEVITLEKGKGAMVVSTPDSAQVEVDSKVMGKTPLHIEDLPSGEHLFLISHSNYLKRSIRALVVDNFRLNLNVDLAISEADLTKLQTEPIKETARVVVRNTPTGFLRVRSQANINSREVGRVSPGEELVVLEELPNWVRVRFGEEKEGYVSSQYIEKK